MYTFPSFRKKKKRKTNKVLISCRTSNRIITLDEFAWGADEGKKEEGNKIGRGRGKFVVLKNQISSGQVTRTEEGGGREGCVSETACICRWDASALQIKAGEGEEGGARKKAGSDFKGGGNRRIGKLSSPPKFRKSCLEFLGSMSAIPRPLRNERKWNSIAVFSVSARQLGNEWKNVNVNRKRARKANPRSRYVEKTCARRVYI